MKTRKKMQITPIGVIHSPYHKRSDAPPQGKNETVEIEIYPEYQTGLKDIEGFSHVHVFYWLHQSNNYSLLTTTPWDTTPHGLFTTRSPHRPNPLGYSVVELLEQKNNILVVKGLDAINDTPVVDIKPYIEKLDCKTKTAAGWTGKTHLGDE